LQKKIRTTTVISLHYSPLLFGLWEGHLGCENLSQDPKRLSTGINVEKELMGEPAGIGFIRKRPLKQCMTKQVFNFTSISTLDAADFVDIDIVCQAWPIVMRKS